MADSKQILVTGAAGFIGGHLVSFLKRLGHRVRGVDIVGPQYRPSDADRFDVLDLRDPDACRRATEGVDEVYALAADMGGMGFISGNHARILHNNLLINLHTLEAARKHGIARYLLASSACVYPEYRQDRPGATALREEDAYPAQPQEAYGWEKLTAERLCIHYGEEYGLETRIARFHNVFGPHGAWSGGREKAPAAICRKVAVAKLTGDRVVEVWGDGGQTRSFCFIDDAVVATTALMASNFRGPLNIGQERAVSIDWLVDAVSEIAGVSVVKRHVEGPVGVAARNSNSALAREVLGWEPQTSLEDGLRVTYEWVEEQVRRQIRGRRGTEQRRLGGHEPMRATP